MHLSYELHPLVIVTYYRYSNNVSKEEVAWHVFEYCIKALMM